MLLPPVRSLRSAAEAIAAIAQTDAEMGETDDTVRQHVMDLMRLVGLSSRDDLLAIADQIKPAQQHGLITHEGDGLRARAIVLDLASVIEDGGATPADNGSHHPITAAGSSAAPR